MTDSITLFLQEDSSRIYIVVYIFFFLIFLVVMYLIFSAFSGFERILTCSCGKKLKIQKLELLPAHIFIKARCGGCGHETQIRLV